MKWTGTIAVSWMIVGTLLATASSADDDDRPPNIIFFLVDDLGWRDLGCYGSDFYDTPTIDEFARWSTRFTQAYAACHVCSPTRASIMTGKYPARLRLTDWLPGRKDFSFQQLKNAEHLPHLPLDEITLAEELKKHGYRTAHLGKWHLGEDPHGPLQQGFDIQIPDWNKGWPKAGYFAPFEMEGLEARDGRYLTDQLTDEAVKFIEASRDTPFFLYLSHFAVHDPIQGRPDFRAKYRHKAAIQENAGDDFVLEGNPDDASSELVTPTQDPASRGHQLLPNRSVKVKQHQDNIEFAAMIEAMDESLGRVLGKVMTLDLQDDTIVIFFSDNGGMSAANFGRPDRVIGQQQLDRAYSTSNLPLRGSKGWLYEGGIRVPLIIHWWGHGKPGAVIDEPVISTDFYPTILELAGIDLQPSQHVDGVSLVPLINGDTTLDRDAIYWHFPHYSNHGLQSPGGAVRAGDFKLLEYFENDSVQLFNLKDDPGEQNDLSESMPRKVEELREMLHAWRKDVDAQMMAPNPGFTASDDYLR